jgi:hypothetical protein
MKQFFTAHRVEIALGLPAGYHFFNQIAPNSKFSIPPDPETNLEAKNWV